MNIYRLGQIVPPVPSVPSVPAPPMPFPAPNNQQPDNQALGSAEQLINNFINQNKHRLPISVRQALTNPMFRPVIVDLLQSLSDPANQQFFNQFLTFMKSMVRMRASL